MILIFLCSFVVLLGFVFGENIDYNSRFKYLFENDDPKEIGYFFMFADSHIDFEYLVGGDPDCPSTDSYPANYNYNLCCRKTYPNQTIKAGDYGYIGHCDIPKITFEKMLDFSVEMSVEVLPEYPSFIFYLGDNPAHDIKTQTKEDNLEHLSYVYNLLDTTFGYKSEKIKCPVYGCVGNHDAFPLDQLAYRPKGSWFLDAQFKVFEPYLSEKETLEVAKEYGYYSQLFTPGLRIISMNTQWASSRNNFIEYKPIMMEWLTSELTNAEKNGEKVYLIGHLVPGYMFYTSKWNHVFDEWNSGFRKLCIRFKNTIIAQFYGHEHVDRFSIIRDDEEEEEAIGIAYLASSMTTFEKVNPSVRLFKYDKNTFELIDSLTFYNNINNSNFIHSMEKNWKLEYSAIKDYKMKDLSPKEWDKVLKRAEEDESFWKVFKNNLFVQNEKLICDDNCKKMIICCSKCVAISCYKKCIES